MHNIESLIGIFTVDKGKIKILLMKKKENPYKGYWILPNSILNNNSLDENIADILNNLGIPKLYNEQVKTYSNVVLRDAESIIGISYIGLIDSITYNLKQVKSSEIELEWFDVNTIPKTAYEHNILINDLYEYFKSKIINSNILRILFPSDFTLPELQKVYEQVLAIKIDRRNFRKKLINLGYINSTGDINEGYTGRPAKLYRFNLDAKEKNLF